MQPVRKSSLTPIEIEGTSYYSAADICRELGVARQTLWRWRTEGKVPMGRKYRDHQVLFTEREMGAIREHANRLEPLGMSATQLKLFRAKPDGH